MKIHLYILKDYLKFVAATEVMCIFLFILFDFIHKSTRYFAQYSASSKNIGLYYTYQIPMHLIQSMPIASLLASVITMVLLSRTNEITAMRAAGMGPWALGLPLAVGGAFLSITCFLLGEYAIPNLARKMYHVKHVLIEGQRDDDLTLAHWIRDGRHLVHFQQHDPIHRTLKEVKIIEIDHPFKPIKSTEADEARYIGGHDWLLKNLTIRYFSGKSDIVHVEARSEQRVSIRLKPDELKNDSRTPNEMSLSELRGIIQQGKRQGSNVLPFQVDFQMKLAYPFAALVVCLIGLKFGYRSERTTETVKGILLAFFVGISYWFILSSARALGKRGDIPPIVAAWSANIVVFALSCIQILRAKKH